MPVALTLIVGVLVAIRIVSFYADYYGKIYSRA